MPKVMPAQLQPQNYKLFLNFQTYKPKFFKF